MSKGYEASSSGDDRDQMTRLPQLANATIHTNIRDEIEKLRKSPAWQQHAGRSSETLVKYEDFRIVLVLMKPGSYMKDHHADGPISVHAIQGKFRMKLADGETVELGPGDILALKSHLHHDVEAIEESAFLLTISWPREGAPDRG